MFASFSTQKFPVWHYLNQPLFDSTYTPVLNPRRFWYAYQIQFLERCLEMNHESMEQQ
ncbi:MAG: hypothetical protein VKJ24_02520 [Synechococcales bacterium]|nr:hypothetical protein [Synechococcales bacterium]